VSPERRRRAVTVLQQCFGVSQRRACRVVGQHRTAQQRPAPAPVDGEAVLRARLRQISVRYPRWGWRKAHAIARREGLVVNRKRTRRLDRRGTQTPAQGA
jgi:putative transposase